MILYIGNNLSLPNSNVTTLQLLTKLLKQDGYKVVCTSSKTNQVLRLIDMLFSVVKYRNTINYILIDTYSTRNFYYAFLSSQLARLLNLKYIPILHGGSLPNRLTSSPKMSQMLFGNSFSNIAPSNYLKSEFKKHGYDSDYIPNILELATYNFKRRTNFHPKLLYVRALHKLYNPKMAIYVLAELKKEYPNAELCIVGPDKDGSLNECKELAMHLKVSDSVIFKGLLLKKQWHKLSENYDIFINTTTVDNTPISVMEAMALGLPVVSTNVGGISYLIKDGESGVLVKPNDVSEMVLAIKNVISNSLHYSGVAFSARKEVERFDWKVVKELWNRLLK